MPLKGWWAMDRVSLSCLCLARKGGEKKTGNKHAEHLPFMRGLEFPNQGSDCKA